MKPNMQRARPAGTPEERLAVLTRLNDQADRAAARTTLRTAMRRAIGMRSCRIDRALIHRIVTEYLERKTHEAQTADHAAH